MIAVAAPRFLGHLPSIRNLGVNSVNNPLLDKVEHDIMNYQNRGLCYLPKLKAEADNTDTRFK